MSTHRILAVCLLLLGSLAVQAGEVSATRAACRADYSRLCSGIQPGGERVAQCLRAHQAELSDTCRASLDAIAQCGAQVKQVCGDSADRAKLRQCLQAHKNDLGDGCRGVALSR